MQVVILEPIDESTTKQYTYLVSDIDENNIELLDDVFAGQKFAAKGAIEDLQIVQAAQQGLLSGANEFLEFALFESFIAHLHTHLSLENERIHKPCGN
jgi:hypothetical protein